MTNPGLKAFFIITFLLVTGCIHQQSENEKQPRNILHLIECECDTTLHLRIFDTLQIRTYTPTIPANWEFSTLSSGIIDSIGYFHGSSIDTGGSEENWKFISTSPGPETLSFEFTSILDSTVYKYFKLAIEVN